MPRRPPRSDWDDEPAVDVGAGTVSHGVDDPLGAALLDALAAVARARVHLAESTPDECAGVAARLAMLRAEVAALPEARPRHRIGFGPDGTVSPKRARELRDEKPRRKR